MCLWTRAAVIPHLHSPEAPYFSLPSLCNAEVYLEPGSSNKSWWFQKEKIINCLKTEIKGDWLQETGTQSLYVSMEAEPGRLFSLCGICALKPRKQVQYSMWAPYTHLQAAWAAHDSSTNPQFSSWHSSRYDWLWNRGKTIPNPAYSLHCHIR